MTRKFICKINQAHLKVYTKEVVNLLLGIYNLFISVIQDVRLFKYKELEFTPNKPSTSR